MKLGARFKKEDGRLEKAAREKNGRGSGGTF